MSIGSLLPLVICTQLTLGLGSPDAAGRVVAAPHGGYDQRTEDLARDVADRLDWGWVTAIGYRSEPYRFWFDVNRPTERPWLGYRFGDDRYTARAHEVFGDYLRALGRAGRVSSGRLDLLVEIHGHARRVRAGGSTLRIEAVELATSGFTRDALRRLAREWDRLQRDLPADLRVPLAIDRLDDRYEYEGWLVPFYFRASDAKREGALHPDVTRRALHFELPQVARDTARARRYYARLLADLIEAAR